MIIQTLAFYLFSAICVASGVMVISSRNPVHSVLYLILAFFNASGLFILLGAEFLAMTLVVVYVGAVAVLFLFVVMMLDVNFAELRQGFLQYLPIGGVIGLILLFELVMIVGSWVISPDTASVLTARTPGDVTNTHAIGRILYTDYLYVFQVSGLILMVAMIGAIVLTLRARVGVRKQSIAAQIGRKRENTLEIVKVPSGKGV